MSSLRDYQTIFPDLNFFLRVDFGLQPLGQVLRYPAAKSCRKVAHEKMSPKHKDHIDSVSFRAPSLSTAPGSSWSSVNKCCTEGQMNEKLQALPLTVL